MPTAVHLIELAALCVALAAGAAITVLTARAFRDTVRKTSPDALRVVLDPSAVAEEAEWEFTAMLHRGELSQTQYRTLIASLAEDLSAITPRAKSTAKDRLSVS